MDALSTMVVNGTQGKVRGLFPLGVAAAPFAAIVVRFAPRRVMMAGGGCLIVALGLYGAWRTLSSRAETEDTACASLPVPFSHRGRAR